MKKLIFLSVVLVSVLVSSCTGCSQSGKRKQMSDVQANEQTVNETNQVVVDYQTPYDSIISSLKKMPEYKDVFFLSQKETQEYLAMCKKQEKRFASLKRYLLVESTRDTVYMTADLKISVDTTQSFRPIADWSYWSKHGENDSYSQQVQFFYLPKIKVGYLKQNTGWKDFDTTYLSGTFDAHMREGFPEEKYSD